MNIEANIPYIIKVLLQTIITAIVFYEIFKDIRSNIFPAYLNFTLVFLLCLYHYIFKNKSNNYILEQVSIILLIWFLIEYFHFRKKNPRFHAADKKAISKFNFYLFIIDLAAIFIFIGLSKFLNKKINYSLIITTTLIAINPAVHKYILWTFKKKLLAIDKIKNSDLSNHIFVLPKIRTFIFDDAKIIRENKYELINMEHRATIKKETLKKIAFQLTQYWDKEYALAINKEAKNKTTNKNFIVIKKNTSGIKATDTDGKEYIFGNTAFVANILKTENSATHFLFRNNILIGKFTFKEKWNQQGLNLVKKLDNLGNVVLITSKPESNDIAQLPFDKVYYNLSVTEKEEIILKLSRKAKTALIYADKNLKNSILFKFFISNSQKMLDVYEILYFAQKGARLMNGTFIIFLLFNLLNVLLALFMYKNSEYALWIIWGFSFFFLGIINAISLKNN